MSRFPSRCSSQRGNTSIEFIFIALVLFLVMFASLEFDRMLFVYTNLADAAKAGVRYAIVRGSDRTSGSLGSGDTTAVEALVKGYAQGVDKSKLTVTVSYLDGSSNATGKRVGVVVTYPYDPWVVLPLGVTLSATSQGVITW